MIDPKAIYDRLTGKHNVSEASAAGILANIEHESRFDPSAIGDSGTSGGLFQHHGARWNNLKAFARSVERDWQDWETQVDFAIKEARGMGINLQATDPIAASREWTLRFERPANAEQKATQRAKSVFKYMFDRGGGPSFLDWITNPSASLGESLQPLLVRVGFGVLALLLIVLIIVIMVKAFADSQGIDIAAIATRGVVTSGS